MPCGNVRTRSANWSRRKMGQHAGFRQSPQTFSRGKISRSKKSCSQTGVRAKCRAARSSGSAAHDCHIEHVLLSGQVGSASRSGGLQPPANKTAVTNRRSLVFVDWRFAEPAQEYDCRAPKRKARPDPESARGAAQTRCVLDARSLQSRHLRGESAGPAQTRRLLLHALQAGPGRHQDARDARCGLGLRNPHGAERAGVALARRQADQGISAALQHFVSR